MPIEKFEKLQHILGDLGGHAHMQECVLAQEITEKATNLSPLADLFEVLLKQEVEAKVV